MNINQIFESANVYEIHTNNIYKKYLVPYELIPKEEYRVFGCFLMNFKDKNLMKAWLEIYQLVVNKINSISGITQLLKIIPIKKFDENTIEQARPFNEGYTSSAYEEFLNFGSCQPNEMILQNLCSLHVALVNIGIFDGFSSKESIILNVIHKTLVKPNSELVWGEQWLMYLPVIELDHLLKWEKLPADNT